MLDELLWRPDECPTETILRHGQPADTILYSLVFRLTDPVSCRHELPVALTGRRTNTHSGGKAKVVPPLLWAWDANTHKGFWSNTTRRTFMNGSSAHDPLQQLDHPHSATFHNMYAYGAGLLTEAIRGTPAFHGSLLCIVATTSTLLHPQSRALQSAASTTSTFAGRGSRLLVSTTSAHSWCSMACNITQHVRQPSSQRCCDQDYLRVLGAADHRCSMRAVACFARPVKVELQFIDLRTNP